MAKRTESCGRCSMSIVVDAVDEEDGTDERDPFDGERIEVDEREMQRVSPDAWIARLSTRINTAINRLIWRN